jgi:hypothetical protein
MAKGSKHAQSGRKGRAVEHLVAASCVLSSGGDLNASTALVDDEGIDIVFHQRGTPKTLAVQVKSRFIDETGSKLLREQRIFSTDVGEQTFAPRDNLFMLFVVAEAASAEIGPMWFVPRHDFARLANRGTPKKLRITASMNELSKDKWSDFRLERQDLAPAILARLNKL